MKNRLKLLIWGLGREYNKHVNILKYWERQNEIEIIGLTDTDAPDVSEIDGWKVYKTCQVIQLEVDYYLVMSQKSFLDIFNDMLALNVEKTKILSSKILDIPYFNWEQYSAIQKSGLSIICNNCVGGILYDTLGLECKSPCKNLSIPADSFFKLIQNLKWYMSLELEFKLWREDPHSEKAFPVMSLGDIEIWCNHDSFADEARKNWERRKVKLNYENIVLVMYTENDVTGKKFLETTDYKKVLFVPEKSTLEGHNVFKLRLFPGQKEFWEVVNSSASLEKNSYSYKLLDMLNGKKEYRY